MSTLTNILLAGTIAVGSVYALSIPESLTGPARVIDGDTIVINTKHIRLWGIDAPESSQPQGPAATSYLYNLTRNQTVSCDPKDQDKYKRIVARCFVEDRDIGQLMVATGNAVDYTRYSHGFYKDAETAAKQERLGIWAGPFEMPEKWRADHKRY
jgi:endonuclease YncB( thermonuclease family)